MAGKANSTDLLKLLSEGQTYLWALRHSREPDQTEARRDELRELEQAMARYPHASHARPRQDQYQRLNLDEFHVYANGALCERGIEAGIELFPVEIDWSFCHIEVQYCTGGDTPMDATLVSNRTESKRLRAGDVMVIPKSAHLVYHSSEEGERFGHAHIFLTNLGGMIGENYYDVFHTMRLRTLASCPVPARGSRSRTSRIVWR